MKTSETSLVKRWAVSVIAATFAVVSFAAVNAHADYSQRFEVGAGVAELKNPDEADFTLGVEYEYRLSPFWGIGAFGSYIFSTPGITTIGWPQVSVHPFLTEFLINAAPIVQTGGNVGSHVGARVGTRLPIPIGAISIIPTFAVDLISGGPNYIYGLGIQI